LQPLKNGKKFRKSLQNLCQSGGDLEELPSYVHFKPKAGCETSLQLKVGKRQRLNDKIGVGGDCELDDQQLKKKLRRKEESEPFIV